MRAIAAGAIMLVCMLVYAVPRSRAAMTVGDVKKELQTAIFHATELAQRGGAVAASKLHLQHVINCLEGPTGSNFNASAGYPCEGQGQGIIPDLKVAVTAKVQGADQSLREATVAWNLAVQGIAKDTVSEVQSWAKVVGDHLKAALSALGG